jgi:hypothetical protein
MESRSLPGATDIRAIVGDTHGDHIGMLQALRQLALSTNGEPECRAIGSAMSAT